MNIILAGADGGIGRAMLAELVRRGHYVSTISRSANCEGSQGSHLSTVLSQAESVVDITAWLDAEEIEVDAVICCSGLLHNEQQGPEKALNQLSADWLNQNIALNVLPSVHLAQAIARRVNRRNPIRWLSLSAMVGSIEDNQLGGWYSYRMSKAALNMLIKNISIEWTRKSPDSIIAAIHPGTTDTALSKPFQAAIADGKLYTAELSAERICDVFESLTAEQNGRLLHWNGETIPF